MLVETSKISYNNGSVKETLQPTRYTLAYEKGELVRRGKKTVRGHEVTLYTNYSRLPRDIRGDVLVRLLVEVAKAPNPCDNCCLPVTLRPQRKWIETPGTVTMRM